MRVQHSRERKRKGNKRAHGIKPVNPETGTSSVGRELFQSRQDLVESRLLNIITIPVHHDKNISNNRNLLELQKLNLSKDLISKCLLIFLNRSVYSCCVQIDLVYHRGGRGADLREKETKNSLRVLFEHNR